MSLTNEDIELSVSKLQNIIHSRQESHKIENELFNLFDLLRKDAELSKINENASQMSLQQFISCENKDIIENYIILKESNKKLKEENEDLANRLDSAVIENIAERETLNSDYTQKIHEIEQKYRTEIEMLRTQNETNKRNYDEQITHLLNQLSANQASTVLQCDEIETKLKRQLVDVNNKLRDSQNHCRSLNMEIQHLKGQIKNQSLKQTPNRNSLTFRESPNINRSFNQLDISVSKASTSLENIQLEDASKYPHLQIRKNSNLHQDVDKNSYERIPPPPLYKSYQNPQNKFTKTTKKRKLYNPDETDSDLPEY